MENLVNVIMAMTQDQAVVVLFACILSMVAVSACMALLLRGAGKWGTVALFLALAVVVIVWRLSR